MRKVAARLVLAAFALILAGCAVNLHPQGACPTPGVSPLASNCPTAEEIKGK